MNQAGNSIVKLWYRITQPHNEDPEKAQREQVIRSILLLFSITQVFLIGILYPVWLTEDFKALLVFAALLIVTVLGWWLIYMGHPFLAGAAIAGTIFMGGAFLSYTDGLNSNASILYAVAILMFAMFVGNRARWIVLVLSIVTHIGLGLGFHSGSQPFLTVLAASVASSFSLLGVAMIEGSYSHLLKKALSQSRQMEDKLRTEIIERVEVEQRLKQMSTHDQLTGLFNRAFFEAELERLENSRQFPVCVVVADVDGLKRINDRYGHAAGDAHLVQAAKLISSTLRAEDILARIGGDEFAFLLPQTDPAMLRVVINRLRKNLDDYNRVHPDRAIEFAIGNALAEAGADLHRILQQADDRMHEDKFRRKAKTSG